MASSSSYSITISVLYLLTIFSCVQLLLCLQQVSCFEFQVGETDGWVVPPANDSKIYNDWASEKRFKVGDTVRFKYKKDSVLEVTESDYKQCNSTHPNLFSNTGNSVFQLDHPGLYYFISGASGHCERGQRMIVKVMSQDDSSSSTGGTSSAAIPSCGGVFQLVSFQFLSLYLVSYLAGV